MKNCSGNILDDFLKDIYSGGAARSTLDAYRKDIAYFAKWYMDMSSKEPHPWDITSIDLREYQGYMQNIQGLKPATVNRRMAALEKYIRWAHEKGYVGRLPVFPKIVREQKTPPKALERVEQNRLLREAERRGKTRDIALIRLMMSCGLRVSEAVSIRLVDLDIGERHGTVAILGKGNKYREVPVPPEARKAIREWMAERTKRYPDSDWLFPNRNGGHITARNAEQVIKNIGKFAGLDIHPHVLRHTAATNMLRTGADLVTVAQVLGHANLNTTAIYTKPDRKTMMEALEKGEI
ncbi:integrase/recombinase XerC [Desulforamulus putei DSM 12395]|uniref:Integrase/recombinase XerC n=1 Tax=Desulforamulus putei DSM 12395 TaxID=1121429 RepID=A0A1M5CN03_9FIRM|nr:tyrosine-type recombinase/integrase [Desulforamulus putei]SHF56103.1 integrase/recombinase XerC [Desulforamulus putei DSM 12395]